MHWKGSGLGRSAFTLPATCTAAPLWSLPSGSFQPLTVSAKTGQPLSPCRFDPFTFGWFCINNNCSIVRAIGSLRRISSGLDLWTLTLQTVWPSILERPSRHADPGQCQLRGRDPADRSARVLQPKHLWLRHCPSAAKEALACFPEPAGAVCVCAALVPHSDRQSPLRGYRVGVQIGGWWGKSNFSYFKRESSADWPPIDFLWCTYPKICRVLVELW